VKANLHRKVYTVLMIITDGELEGMPETKRRIVEASVLPLSIVIIGVGKGPFDSMVELDGDKTPLVDSNGKETSRDIVDFVPFNDFLDKGVDALAAKVLEEIPGQFMSYIKSMQSIYS